MPNTSNAAESGDLETPQDRLIDTLLRETLGRQTPPNLVHRILSKAARGRRRYYWTAGGLSAAAAVLIGLAVWRFALPQKPADQAGITPPTQPEIKWEHQPNVPNEQHPDLNPSPRPPDPSEWAYGQTIKTGDQPRTLNVGGYCKIEAAANSALTHEGKEKAEQVFLDAGRVTCEVNRNVGAFAVRTDSGMVSVTGTKFSVTLSGEGNNQTGEHVRKKQLTVKVEAGSVELNGFATTLHAGEEGGIAFGTAKKGENYIDVRDDGAREPRRFTPSVHNGLDREIIEQIAKIPDGARVQVAWVKQDYMRATKIVVLWKPPETTSRDERSRQHGTVVGVIIEKGTDGIRVQESTGGSERYMPRWREGEKGEKGGLDKDVLRVLEKLKEGDKVRVDWILEEHRRILKIEKVANEKEKDKE